MAPRRPHVVSAGYLRNFAAGKLIRVVSKADKLHSAPISVKDTFVRSNFLRVIQQGVSTDDAEDEFALSRTRHCRQSER